MLVVHPSDVVQIAKRFLHPGDTLAEGVAKLACAPQAQPQVPADAMRASPTQAAEHASDAIAAEHSSSAIVSAETFSLKSMQSQAQLAANPGRATYAHAQGSQAECTITEAPDTRSQDTIAQLQRSHPRGGFVLAGEQAPESRSMVANGEVPWGSKAAPGNLQRDREISPAALAAMPEAQATHGRAEQSSGEPAAAAEPVHAHTVQTPTSSAAYFIAGGGSDHAAPSLWLTGADEVALNRAAGPATQSTAVEQHVEPDALAPLQVGYPGHGNRDAADHDDQPVAKPLSGVDDASTAQQAGSRAHANAHAAQGTLAHAAVHEPRPVPAAPQASEKARALIVVATALPPPSAGQGQSPPQQPDSNRNSNAAARTGAKARREAASDESVKDVKAVDLGSASKDGTAGAKLRNQANSTRAGKPGKKRTFASMLKRK